MNESIADYLVKMRYITREQASAARAVCSGSVPEPRNSTLGDYMVEKGYASPEQIEAARKAQQSTGEDIATVLIDLGLNPRDVYESKAQEMQVPFVDLNVYKPDDRALASVPEEIARRHNVIPLKRDHGTLYVALGDFNNVAANDEIRLVSRCAVRGVLAVPEHITEAIDRLYRR